MNDVLEHGINWIGGPAAGLITNCRPPRYVVVKGVLVRIEDEHIVDENEYDA
jgi:hypothetical protein